ncbi:hypothetical protein [Actinomadura roseirufa]|uniref:hypothetical protein n=1 Tax=Actinomadura roseirufa TaxID=2094049 RepID=UPI0010410D1A|nr:hypothetical protein [Actinomadura roseirufa]
METISSSDDRGSAERRTGAYWIGVAAGLGRELAGRSGAPGEASPTEVGEALKAGGLVTLMGPPADGGGGRPWSVAHRVVRTLAAADLRAAQVLAYHYLWSRLADFVGTDEKVAHVAEVSAQHRWLFGGDAGTGRAGFTVTDRGDDIVFTGTMESPVAVDAADVILLSGRFAGTGTLVSGIARWDNPALEPARRHLSSGLPGPVRIEGLELPWSGAQGYVGKRFAERAYNYAEAPVADLFVTHLYLGLYDASPSRIGEVTDRAEALDARLGPLLERGDELHAGFREVTLDEVLAFQERAAAVRAEARAVALAAARETDDDGLRARLETFAAGDDQAGLVSGIADGRPGAVTSPIPYGTRPLPRGVR